MLGGAEDISCNRDRNKCKADREQDLVEIGCAVESPVECSFERDAYDRCRCEATGNVARKGQLNSFTSVMVT